jgi:hypothetical protein
MFWIIFLSIPFFYLWNYLAPIYFSGLPALYLSIPFWHCVGLFALAAIVRAMLLPHSGHHHFSPWHWHKKW